MSTRSGVARGVRLTRQPPGSAAILAAFVGGKTGAAKIAALPGRKTVPSLGQAVVRGIAAGLVAGVPQVLLTQAETTLLDLPREQADIGPRFIRRLAERVLGERMSEPMHWLLATIFHFGYAAQWGALYAVLHEQRPMPPLIGGPMLAGLIYTLAFSPWGAATQTGTERPPERRSDRETLLHWTAALSFSLTTAYVYRWLRPRSTVEDAAQAVADRLGA